MEETVSKVQRHYSHYQNLHKKNIIYHFYRQHNAFTHKKIAYLTQVQYLSYLTRQVYMQ